MRARAASRYSPYMGEGRKGTGRVTVGWIRFETKTEKIEQKTHRSQAEGSRLTVACVTWQDNT